MTGPGAQLVFILAACAAYFVVEAVWERLVRRREALEEARLARLYRLRRLAASRRFARARTSRERRFVLRACCRNIMDPGFRLADQLGVPHLRKAPLILTAATS